MGGGSAATSNGDRERPCRTLCCGVDAAPPVVVGVELVNRPSAEPEAMWESPMGEAEHVLYAEVSSRWIAWRDALLRAGVVDRAELAGRTIELEIKWPNTPHVGFRGRTPRQVVLAERKAREKGGNAAEIIA